MQLSEGKYPSRLLFLTRKSSIWRLIEQGRISRLGRQLRSCAEHPHHRLGRCIFGLDRLLSVFDPARGPNTNVVLRARDVQTLARAKRAVEDMLERVGGAQSSGA